jgi:hypothetical protein
MTHADERMSSQAPQKEDLRKYLLCLDESTRMTELYDKLSRLVI